jgi:very-short-patch-repair endonuclease
MKLPSTIFPTVCERSGLPIPVQEHRFHAVRKWRFDWAWPEAKVALEVEGGVWTGGRHTRASGFIGDIEKYNEATIAGWRVLRCVPSRLVSSETVEMLRRAITPMK